MRRTGRAIPVDGHCGRGRVVSGEVLIQNQSPTLKRETSRSPCLHHTRKSAYQSQSASPSNDNSPKPTLPVGRKSLQSTSSTPRRTTLTPRSTALRTQTPGSTGARTYAAERTSSRQYCRGKASRSLSASAHGARCDGQHAITPFSHH